MKKNVLVTGATSQIGQFLLPKLDRDSYRIYAVSRNKKVDCDNITWIQWDFTSLEDNCDFNRVFDVVIHLAEINFSYKVLDICKPVERFIAFSSTSAVSKSGSNNEEDRKLSESLLLAEARFIEKCDNYGVNWTLFRPTLIYGAGIDQNITFISKFIKNYGFFPIVGDGMGLRQPVHARDLADACILSMVNQKTFYKIYNLAGGETLTYIDMVRRIFKSLNKRVIIIKFPKFFMLFGISLLKIHPKYRHLTTGMVDRINTDLCFYDSKTKDDFSYNPGKFIPNEEIQNDL